MPVGTIAAMQRQPARSPWWSLAPLCLAVALYKIDSTIVNVALPALTCGALGLPCVAVANVAATILRKKL